MRITARLKEALNAQGYDGVPQIFRYELESGEKYDRSTHLTQEFLDDAFTPQVMTIVNTIENTALPHSTLGKKVKRAWAEDELGNVVKEIKL